MLSISEIVNDTDFAENYVITRDYGGSFKLGVWVPNLITVNAYGTVEPATPKELLQIPDGDRVQGMMCFWASQVMYTTSTTNPNANNEGSISDTIAWQGNQWRIIKVTEWFEFGYWKAYAVRMTGA